MPNITPNQINEINNWVSRADSSTVPDNTSFYNDVDRFQNYLVGRISDISGAAVSSTDFKVNVSEYSNILLNKRTISIPHYPNIILAPLYANGTIDSYKVFSVGGVMFTIIKSADRWYIENQVATADYFMYHIYLTLKKLEKYKAQ